MTAERPCSAAPASGHSHHASAAEKHERQGLNQTARYQSMEFSTKIQT